MGKSLSRDKSPILFRSCEDHSVKITECEEGRGVKGKLWMAVGGICQWLWVVVAAASAV